MSSAGQWVSSACSRCHSLSLPGLQAANAGSQPVLNPPNTRPHSRLLLLATTRSPHSVSTKTRWPPPARRAVISRKKPRSAAEACIELPPAPFQPACSSARWRAAASASACAPCRIRRPTSPRSCRRRSRRRRSFATPAPTRAAAGTSAGCRRSTGRREAAVCIQCRPAAPRSAFHMSLSAATQCQRIARSRQLPRRIRPAIASATAWASPVRCRIPDWKACGCR